VLLFSVQLFCEIRVLIILKSIQRGIIVNVQYIGLHAQHPLLLSDFNKLEFLDRFSKNTLINFNTIVHWGPNFSMRTDGRTDRYDEANSRLSQFCESV